MTINELAEATAALQEVESEIFEAFRHGQFEKYTELRERLTDARARYNELVAHSFESE